jgi:circadian clock protein KaiC
MTDETTAALARVPSGIDGLDIILEGGFLKGGIYIIQGPPGTGKTTFGNQVCFNHAAGDDRAVYVTLLAEYHARMMQHLRVMTFFDASKIPDQITYINGLAALHESGLKGLVALLRREVITARASMLVLDGIVSARRAANDEQAFNDFIHELQAVAIAIECTVFILTSAQSNIIEPEHTMVDGIVELADELTGWAAASSLQVVKFRGSGFLRGRHAFKITDSGIIVHPRIERFLPGLRSLIQVSTPGCRVALNNSTSCWAAAFRKPPQPWLWDRPGQAKPHLA